MGIQVLATQQARRLSESTKQILERTFALFRHQNRYFNFKRFVRFNQRRCLDSSCWGLLSRRSCQLRLPTRSPKIVVDNKIQKSTMHHLTRRWIVDWIRTGTSLTLLNSMERLTSTRGLTSRAIEMHKE